MFDIGRLALKIAGRDAGKTCVIIDVINEQTVLIDGETRRRKINIKHLEPLNKILEISEGSDHLQVKNAFKSIGLKVFDSKPKEKKAKPRAIKKTKIKPVGKKLKASKKDNGKEASKKTEPDKTKTG